MRRFVTADDPSYLGANGDLVGYNLFAYCSNNPVMYSDPTGHSVVLTILVGVGIGLVGQLAGDLITSAVEGELSFSHWSDYVGAAVGGGVSSLIPIGGDVLSSTVGSATATVVSALAYNIESAILGRDEFYSDEEIFYNVANNAMAGALFSFAFESSKIKSIFPDTKIPGTEHEWRDIVGALSVFGAVKNAMEIPSTHTWDSPNVERWYPFR